MRGAAARREPEILIAKEVESRIFRVSFSSTALAVGREFPSIVRTLLSGRKPEPLKNVTLNADLCRKALEKVGSPNTLVNLVSKRVRQLNSAGGTGSRPLVLDTATMGAADIALLEIVDDKITYDQLPDAPAQDPATKRRRRG